MHFVECDTVSGAEIYQLTDGPRPADNIYGEQPYSSPCGTRIAVRYYPHEGTDGGLSILDLVDGSLHPVLKKMPRFPAFHAWGEFLYFQQHVGKEMRLRRCHYVNTTTEDVLVLPATGSQLSYGTVSPDLRYYAVNSHSDRTSSRLLLFDLVDGVHSVLAESSAQWFKHEQFSRDGRDAILIQANSTDVSVVNLGVVYPGGGEIEWLPVDSRPLVPVGKWPGRDRYTPRCTGHEAWIGKTDRVFLSTAYDSSSMTNVWSVSLSDEQPAAACVGEHVFGHVATSGCGRFWIADAPSEEGIPIYIGSFATGSNSRLCISRTVHDGQQWSHTHPYLTADNRWVIFTSNRSGIPQIYGARLADGFLSSL